MKVALINDEVKQEEVNSSRVEDGVKRSTERMYMCTCWIFVLSAHQKAMAELNWTKFNNKDRICTTVNQLLKPRTPYTFSPHFL